jgi:zinc-ribbon domain
MVVCPRCGTQNPDGNAYCQNCGALLNASPGYQSPYYTPAPGSTVRIHRTPWLLIIAVVVALTVLMAGLGTALAIVGNRGTQNTSGGGIAVELPSPTPGATPSPVGSPTPEQAATGLVSNDAFSLTVPAGWRIDTKDNESIVLLDANIDGSVTISSGPSVPPQTAQQNKDTVDSTLRAKYPDTRDCPNSKATSSAFNGANGIAWTLCFTLTAGGNSVPAAASVFAGANGSGSVYYLVIELTRQSDLQSYLESARPVMQSVRWKLS